MKMYLISDNIDTLTGMRLAGVEGVVVHEMQEVKEALDKVLADKEIGIVLLTEKFGRDFPKIVESSLMAPKAAEAAAETAIPPPMPESPVERAAAMYPIPAAEFTADSAASPAA